MYVQAPNPGGARETHTRNERIMFGKHTRDSTTPTPSTPARSTASSATRLRPRPSWKCTNCSTGSQQVESQINSQFTSLATYAQIAQEQVEVARSEARATHRAVRTAPHLTHRARARRPHLLVHGRGPWRLRPRRHRPPRRPRALRRPDPQGTRRMPPTSEGPRRGDRHDVRVHAAEPHRGRAGRGRSAPNVEQVDAEVSETEVFETAEVIAFAPLTLDPPTIAATSRRRRSTAPSPTCPSTADAAPTDGVVSDATCECRSTAQRRRSRSRWISGRFPCACRLRPTWDRSASG